MIVTNSLYFKSILKLPVFGNRVSSNFSQLSYENFKFLPNLMIHNRSKF